MSSFLCFICHSTVNSDTNEETREKYREIVGMNLCPDSHLCYICCHVLNKLSLFRSICLKRSLEYPVLFSEKGTVNLRRSDIELHVLCPDDTCDQYQVHISRSHQYTYNSPDNYTTTDNYNEPNQYVALEDDFRDYFNQFHNHNVKKETTKDDLKDIMTPLIINEAHSVNDFNDFGFNEQRLASVTNSDNILAMNNQNNDPKGQTPVVISEALVNDINEFNHHGQGLVKVSRNDNDLAMNNNDENAIRNDDCNEAINNDKLIENDEVNDTNFYTTDNENNEFHDKVDDDYIEEPEISGTLDDNTSDVNETEKDTDIKKRVKKKDKDVRVIILTLEEQKAELEANRKKKKYIEAEYKCHHCALPFLFKDTYQAHMMRHEESNGEYKCATCTLRFASMSVLRAHRALHAEKRSCGRCGAQLRRRGAHRCGAAPRAACHLCGGLLKDANGLQQHLKRVHMAKTSNRLYSCSVCAESYPSQTALRTHMIKHINRKFPCDQCAAVYSSPYTLSQHRGRHAAPAQLPCGTCGRVFSTRKSLLAHVRGTHRQHAFECPVCMKTCPNQRAVKLHMQAVHAASKDHACPHCPARYTNRHSLLRHVASHTKTTAPKISVCHICGSSFKDNSKLNRHLKNVCEKEKLEEQLASFYE